MSEVANFLIDLCSNRYSRPEWVKYQIINDGRVEDVCEHGIGHPNEMWLKLHDPTGELGLGIHGCDGCCEN
ncbi:MAG: hypothetical protein ACTSRZ_20280 [Promethearchaeota archaeon]